MAQLFNLSTDQIINYDGKIPTEVVIEDKTDVEQMRLIQQLDNKDKKPSSNSLIKCLPIKSSKTSSIKMLHCSKQQSHRLRALLF
jgi:hypothetical protein